MAAPKILLPEDFETLSMRELVEWHNENCGEKDKIKSFRTIAIGVVRCKALMERIDAQIAFEEETEHLSDEEFQALMMKELLGSVPEEETAVVKEVRKAIDGSTMSQDLQLRQVSLSVPKVGIPEKKKGREKSYSNSEGVAASWLQADTKAKRVTRNHVKVTYNGKTEEFGSVRKAFSAYGLPDSKHIRFRGKLKEAGELTFEFHGEKFHFVVV